MIVFVVVINLCITVINFYIAIKIWQLRQWLVQITRTLDKSERLFHALLYPAPKVIWQGYHKIHNAKQSYLMLRLRWQQAKQVLLLLSWIYRYWQRYV